MSVDLWVEKYRPKTLDEYVWKDIAQREKAEEWIAEGALPNLLLSGTPGSGKTSLAKLLLSQLNITKGDVLEVSASKERKIDEVQDKIVNFGSTYALNDTGIKYVLLDEADSLTPLSQRFLRGETETHGSTTRFILTCNYANKIIPALHSRLFEIKFSALDKDEFLRRALEVLLAEGVDETSAIENVQGYVDMTYPDLRKCLGLLQQHTKGKILSTVPSAEEQTEGKDYLLEMAAMFRNKQFLAARKLIVSQAQVEEYPDIFRYFYKNLDLWGSTEEQQDDALLAIRRALVNHALVGDPEINVAALLVELGRIANS